MITFDFPDHYKGDYWEGVTLITLSQSGVPIDLTDAAVLMQFKVCPTKSAVLELSIANGGITLVNAISGQISIPGMIIDLAPQTYVYDIQYTIPSIAADFVQTPVGGKLKVTQDISFKN